MRVYVLIDKMRGDMLFFLFTDDTFFKPSYRLPAFKFDVDLVCVDVVEEVKEYAAVDRVSCDIERFIDLDE